MATPASGPISMADVNAAFALGYALSAYRAVKWYTPNTSTSGNFTSTNLDLNQFYNKQSTNPATTGSVTYNTAGTYSFTVPIYAGTLTITMNGGGGGGGGEGLSSATNGTAGGTTQISALSLIANGGNGGLGCNTSVGFPAGVSGGTASGGTTNTTGGSSGGGNSVSYGGSSPNGGGQTASRNISSPGNGFSGNAPGGGGSGGGDSSGNGSGGGGGGYCSKAYASGAISFGTVLSITVGAGNTGGTGNYTSGGAGADGQITLTWT